MAPGELLEKGPDADLLHAMIGFVTQRLMEAGRRGPVRRLCGAAHGERTPERTNLRNGYRDRLRGWARGRAPVRQRRGVARIPKLRKGAHFPGCFLEPRRTAEEALAAVIREAYVLQGVSTRRRVDDAGQGHGHDRHQQAAGLAPVREIDERVSALPWRARSRATGRTRGSTPPT